MQSLTRFPTSLALLCTLGVVSVVARADAAPALRKVVDQRGDFVLLGNTFGIDCSDATPSKLVIGTVPAGSACQTHVDGTAPLDLDDSAPDFFFRADDPAAGQVGAAAATTAARARSTAVLGVNGAVAGASLPADATITYARLYWGASVLSSAGAVKQTVAVEREGTFAENVTADSSVRHAVGNGLDWYQNSADVTTLVATHGPGAYRLGGIEAAPIVGVSNPLGMAGWSMVVFYRRDNEPVRNLALFDGLDIVKTNSFASASLSGFLVPPLPAGFDAKLGVLAYDGDRRDVGDSLLFGPTDRELNPSDRLSNALNPVDNFFNGTRSALGLPLSHVGDLPQTSGVPGSFSGLDLDVVDISTRLARGATDARFRATTGGGDPDFYGLGAFVTSISTLKPDFTSSNKIVRNLSERAGGETLPGDTLEYTIKLANNGEDKSARTQVTDQLPASLTFVPGSVVVTDGANDGSKTDAAGDDQAEFVAASRTLTVRVGAGANATLGGSIEKNASATVKFRATVNGNALGDVSNSATISATGFVAEGEGATDPYTWPTGGDAGATVRVDQCATDDDCEEGTCDTEGNPKVCTSCTEETCDADQDGVTDADEGRIGTDPNDPDSDDDGWDDGDESNDGNDGVKIDTDKDGVIDALDKDSDNDCVPDADEISNEARTDNQQPKFDANDNCESGVCNAKTGTCTQPKPEVTEPEPEPTPEPAADDGLSSLEGAGCSCNEAGRRGGIDGLAVAVCAIGLASVLRRRRRD